MTRIRLGAYGIGALALAEGVTVLLGFVTHDAGLVRLQLGMGVAMALNTALALAAGGVALLAAQGGRRWGAQAARLLGAGIAVLACGGLAEDLLNRNLHLDAARFQLWLGAYDPTPGRMAPNTCLGLLCFGLALLGARAPRRGWALTAQVLTGAVIGIGCAGVFGYIFQFDALYVWADATRMAPQTAVGILTLGLGLWLQDRSLAPPRPAPLPTSRRIAATTAFSLLAVATIAGLCGLYLLLRLEQSNAINLLNGRRDERARYIENTIGQRVDDARGLLSAPAPRAAAAYASLGPARFANGLLSQGYSGVVLYDRDGAQIAQSGDFHRQPAVRVELQVPGTPQLLWQQHFYLRLELRPAAGASLPLGRLVLEAPLPQLDELYAGGGGWGATGEMALCGERAPLLVCFPQRLNGGPMTLTPLFEGRLRPMSLALRGATGWMQTRDYRGERVLTAYRPITGTGLGVEVKMDLSELYSPVRRIFEILLPLLALLILLGIGFMFWQMRPLLRELVDSRNRAQHSESRFRAAVASSMDAFYILQAVRGADDSIVDFRLAYLNPNGERLFAQPPGPGLGAALAEFEQGFGAAGWLEKFVHVIGTHQALDEEFSVAAGGGARWLHHQVVSLGDGVAITLRDITGRRAAADRLRLLARYDSLTGLANRASFLDRLAAALATCGWEPRRGGLALLYLDVDHFKLANDSLGHAAGDALLREFGARISACVRASDSVARLGGDEFTVLLEGVENAGVAERVAKAILAGLIPPFDLGGASCTVTASIGVAFHPGGEATPAQLLHCADRALYEVKKRGRNGYRMVALDPRASGGAGKWALAAQVAAASGEPLV